MGSADSPVPASLPTQTSTSSLVTHLFHTYAFTHIQLIYLEIFIYLTFTMASFDSIDETPLSTASHERRNSLEKHLQTRPGMQDLKDRHILLDTNVAP